MILLINAVLIATVLKEIYIKYRFKMDAKANVKFYVRFLLVFVRLYFLSKGNTLYLLIIFS